MHFAKNILCHFSFILGPVLAGGRGSVQQSSEIRSLGAESSPVAASRTPGLGPSPQLSFSSGLGSRSLWGQSEEPNGPRAGVPHISQEPSLPSKRSLPSGSAPLWQASKIRPALSFPSSSGLCLPIQPHSLWYQLLAILPE